ncbi:hypothetical protein P3X46_028692 [Hevea brasiliensis]|uniref:VQ domain-containing protein n=1 Tax=Hevea brasiliensis TaxID=3981 RepID=A0ABQ9KPU5_HEVBR|nr:uncharacterized protein LOC110634401 [Hevea brasiliensis]KAJ9146423.1 hypothetical protein P3X46_028692 [Hevea brasiliensis]
MDSGNSGSMQSSSGDEEYDSRPESLPAFLNPSGHFGPSSSNPQHQPSLLPHHQQPTLFDPSPNLFHAFSQSPTNPNPNTSLLNIDVVRPRGLRSDPYCTDLNSNLLGSQASSSQSFLGAQGSNQGPLPSMQLRSVQDNGARSSSPSDQIPAVARNPKKRTRASRRAPTTVLNTDASNFRAMVQEFTGIPAPPFSGSPYSRRLDLFGTVGSSMRSGQLETMGSLYPFRPSAQKVHQPSSFLFSSSSSSSFSLLNNTIVDATNTATTTNDNNTMTLSIPTTSSNFNPASINYQLPSDIGLPKQPQNMLNMQNQMLSFQSLLQPTALHPSLNTDGLGAKSQANMSLPSLEELGMSHGQINVKVGGLQSHGTTEGMLLRNDTLGSNNNGNQDHLRSLDSCKLNYSAPSSDFHHDKSLENVPLRGEGTVDSWICPSE